MSQATVLDASAILAFLQGEPGEDRVKQALQTEHCVVSAANQSEVIAKSLDRGIDPQAIKTILAELGYTVIDITAEDGTAVRGRVLRCRRTRLPRSELRGPRRQSTRRLAGGQPWRARSR